jgi:hypothetical protein
MLAILSDYPDAADPIGPGSTLGFRKQQRPVIAGSVQDTHDSYMVLVDTVENQEIAVDTAANPSIPVAG